MAVLKGGKFMVFSGTDKKAVAYATNHTLTLETQTNDSSTKDSGAWSEEEVTRLSWGASTDALVAADGSNLDTIFDAWKAKQPIDVVLGIPTNYTEGGVPTAGWTAPTAGCYKGKALITNVSANFQNGADSSVSVTYRGVGELQRVSS